MKNMFLILMLVLVVGSIVVLINEKTPIGLSIFVCVLMFSAGYVGRIITEDE